MPTSTVCSYNFLRYLDTQDYHVTVPVVWPSALQFAAYNGDMEIVRVLLERGANVNVEGDPYYLGR
jgi:hypothetical protein